MANSFQVVAKHPRVVANGLGVVAKWGEVVAKRPLVVPEWPPVVPPERLFTSIFNSLDELLMQKWKKPVFELHTMPHSETEGHAETKRIPCVPSMHRVGVGILRPKEQRTASE